MLKLIPITRIPTKIAALAIPVCEDGDIHNNPDLLELIAAARVLPEFSGEAGQQVTLHHLHKGAIVRCIFMGIGAREKVDQETLRAFTGRAVKNAMAWNLDQVTLTAPQAENLPLDARAIAGAMLEGAALGNFNFTQYKQNAKHSPLKTISLMVSPAGVKKFAPLAADIDGVCQAVHTARQWVSMPSNDKPPAKLAGMIAREVRKSGIKVNTLNEKQLAEKKFNALLAVAAGSANPARLVEMIYTPPSPQKTIVLVGKGVTFDTGGISIKPSQGMDAMKGDMAGAAAVAGTMLAVARLKPGHRIVGITPLVENMPSGTATRPGDIITSYSGKTVEIGNTDAEGRLILADAMAYAIKKFKPDIVIDLATLTGACMVALGEKIAGLFSRDDSLASGLLDAAQKTYERCWRLPLPDDYKDLLKSEFADLSNVASSRYGGAITAALFLSEFTAGTRWAHLDIAGPAFVSKAGDYHAAGGTGFGVRLLCRFIEDL